MRAYALCLLVLAAVFGSSRSEDYPTVNMTSIWSEALEAGRLKTPPPVLNKPDVCGKVITTPAYGQVVLNYDKTKDKDNTVCQFVLQAPAGKRVHIVNIVGYLLNKSGYDEAESMAFYQHPLSSVNVYQTLGGWDKIENSNLAKVGIDARYRDEGNNQKTISKNQYLLVEATFREYKTFANQKLAITYEFFEPEAFASNESLKLWIERVDHQS